MLHLTLHCLLEVNQLRNQRLKTASKIKRRQTVSPTVTREKLLSTTTALVRNHPHSQSNYFLILSVFTIWIFRRRIRPKFGPNGQDKRLQGANRQPTDAYDGDPVTVNTCNPRRPRGFKSNKYSRGFRVKGSVRKIDLSSDHNQTFKIIIYLLSPW